MKELWADPGIKWLILAPIGIFIIVAIASAIGTGFPPVPPTTTPTTASVTPITPTSPITTTTPITPASPTPTSAPPPEPTVIQIGCEGRFFKDDSGEPYERDEEYTEELSNKAIQEDFSDIQLNESPIDNLFCSDKPYPIRLPSSADGTGPIRAEYRLTPPQSVEDFYILYAVEPDLDPQHQEDEHIGEIRLGFELQTDLIKSYEQVRNVEGGEKITTYGGKDLYALHITIATEDKLESITIENLSLYNSENRGDIIVAGVSYAERPDPSAERPDPSDSPTPQPLPRDPNQRDEFYLCLGEGGTQEANEHPDNVQIYSLGNGINFLNPTERPRPAANCGRPRSEAIVTTTTIFQFDSRTIAIATIPKQDSSLNSSASTPQRTRLQFVPSSEITNTTSIHMAIAGRNLCVDGAPEIGDKVGRIQILFRPADPSEDEVRYALGPFPLAVGATLAQSRFDKECDAEKRRLNESDQPAQDAKDLGMSVPQSSRESHLEELQRDGNTWKKLQFWVATITVPDYFLREGLVFDRIVVFDDNDQNRTNDNPSCDDQACDPFIVIYGITIETHPEVLNGN